MSARPRVAVAGAGYFGRFHYDAWSRLPVELVGCCALERGAAEAAAREHGVAAAFTDAERMLDETRPDLLDIAAPPPAHLPLIRAAAARGVAVICQKPFTGTLAGAEEAVAVAEAAGTPLWVHENFRFQPWHAEMKSLVDAGAVGALYQASFRLRPGDGQGPRAYLDRQPYFQRMPRFLVHETLIHLVDVLRFLVGEPTAVTADLRRLNPAIAGEDAGVVLLEFAGGVRGLLDANRLADHPARNRRLVMGEMLVEGDAGCVRLDGDGRIFRRDHGANDEHEHAYEWHDRGFAGDSVHRLQAAALDWLAGRAAPVNTGRDYLANLRIEEAVYRAAARGRRIALDTDGEGPDE